MGLKWLREGLRLARLSGYKDGIAYPLLEMGKAHFELNDVPAARRYLREATSVAESAGLVTFAFRSNLASLELERHEGGNWEPLYKRCLTLRMRVQESSREVDRFDDLMKTVGIVV